jgi:hypothetical protein
MRDPGTGCVCTKCGAVGDEKFFRTPYGTLDSWCKVCKNAAALAWWHRGHTAKPRQPSAWTVIDRLAAVFESDPAIRALFDTALVARVIALAQRWRTRRRR